MLTPELEDINNHWVEDDIANALREAARARNVNYNATTTSSGTFVTVMVDGNVEARMFEVNVREIAFSRSHFQHCDSWDHISAHDAFADNCGCRSCVAPSKDTENPT